MAATFVYRAKVVNLWVPTRLARCMAVVVRDRVGVREKLRDLLRKLGPP
jgi:hypothetical protein